MFKRKFVYKSNQLYGIYQAKPSIVKKDKCILVEGYMDVISMFQSGTSACVKMNPGRHRQAEAVLLC